jgi:hypothetical protein
MGKNLQHLKNFKNKFSVGFRLCPSDAASSSSYGLVNVPSIV